MKAAKQDKPEPRKRRFRLRPMRAAFFGAACLLLAGVGATAAYAFYVQDRMLPHTVVGSVRVGGLTKAEASAKVAASLADFAGTTLALGYGGKEWKVPAKQLGLSFDAQAAVDRAYAAGKSGGGYREVKDFLAAFARTRTVPVASTGISEAGRAALTDAVLTSIETAATETTLDLVPGKVAVVPGKAGKGLDYDDFEAKLSAAYAHGGGTIALVLAPSRPEVTANQAEAARLQAAGILGGPWSITAGTVSATYDAATVAGWLTVSVARDAGGTATGLRVAVKDDALKASLADFLSRSTTKPVNASFKAADGSLAVVQADKPGQGVKADDAMAALKDGLLAATIPADRTVRVSVSATQAELRADNLQELGITQLIGNATTDFAGSPSNRVFNIKKGAGLINGVLVKDGETFSTLGALGSIDTANGWLPELVIKGNRTTPEAGGGLCQVSTTLFRSVMNAGLPVTERQNHSYRVSYYEVGVGPGLDATIYEPSPDFKWKNDTGHAVYIQSSVSGTKITFDLYGTSDGRTAEVGKPTVLETIPAGNPIYADTDTLYVGETKQIEHPHDGAKTTVDYVVRKADGSEVKQTFNSYYVPWPAQYLVGTKPR